jgi:hypothetical protein
VLAGHDDLVFVLEARRHLDLDAFAFERNVFEGFAFVDLEFGRLVGRDAGFRRRTRRPVLPLPVAGVDENPLEVFS